MSGRDYIDAIEVNIADSFVSRENKTGSGNGETRLYVGGRSIRGDFFGDHGFKIFARLKKSDLIRFMEEMKDEYFNPSLEYRGKSNMPSLWENRMKLLVKLPQENIDFYAFDTQRNSPTSDERRIYIDSDDDAFHLLHELPLSGSARLSIVKYRELNRNIYEFKLMPDFDGYSNLPAAVQIERELVKVLESQSNKIPVVTSVERLITARVGQISFRKALLHSRNAKCAFTGITEASLLIAGHIKPWNVSTNEERLSPQNGLLFTPTYDRLFNNGFISFQENRTLMISPLLSRQTVRLLKLQPGMEVEIPILGPSNLERRQFLEYHRKRIFRV
jgi:hypothetical protein